MTRPVFSVIIPCYNQGPFLGACLESIARATGRPHEAIIVNDGSTARSTLNALTKIEPFAEHQALRVVHQENAGLPGARNSGLDVATGRYLKFLDADDMLLETSLDLQADLLIRAEAAGEPLSRRALVLGGYCTYDDASGAFGRPEDQDNWIRGLSFERVAKEWERGLSIPIHCGLFDAELVQPGVRFHTGVRSKEDWLFWMQLMHLGVRPLLLDQDVAVYRTHAQSMTRVSDAKNAHAWLQASAIARETWPDEFDEAALASAHSHFRDFYGIRLWRAFGTSVPWQVYANLDLEKQVRV